MPEEVASPDLLADDRSLAERIVAPLAHLPPGVREQRIAEALGELSDPDLEYLLSWEGQSRPSQRIDPTDDAMLIALIGGRGSGKTRGGAEGVCDRIEADQLRYGGFISRTPGDVRRVMIEGESGFIACAARRGIRAIHQPSLAQIRIVGGGTITTYSAQEPDQLRGPQHDTLWADEFGAWPRKIDAMGNTAFTNAIAGLRLGRKPMGFFTTTPKAIPEIREILSDHTGLWRVARMSMRANLANLAPGFIATIMRMFGGTRLYAQEIEGLYVGDVEGALWETLRIEATRVMVMAEHTWRDAIPELPWRHVAVDPSVAKDGSHDECGIVGGGVGVDRRLYVTHDWSGKLGPRAWADRSVQLYRELGALSIVAEANNGGALVAEAIHNIDPSVPVELVHASNAKRARAEPVSMLWQADPGQQPVASIVGSLPLLEEELTGWDARSTLSPNRLDAMTWLGHRCFEYLFEYEGGWSAQAAGIRLPV